MLINLSELVRRQAIKNTCPDLEVDETILEYVGGIASEYVATKNDDLDE